MKVLVNGVETELGAATGAKVTRDGDLLRIATPQGVKSAVAVTHGDSTFVSVDGRVYEVAKASSARMKSQAAGNGEGRAPMPGQIVEVLVKNGDQVMAGQTLIVMEAMKMQQPVKADFDGVVEGLAVKPGDQVSDGQVLVKVAKADA